MILFPLMIVLSGFFINASIRHLNQSLASYYDFVALTMVLGGTVTLALVLLPWEYRKDIWLSLRFLLRKEKARHHQVLNECIGLISRGQAHFEKPEWLYQKVLKDGLELINLGFSKEKIENILTERVFQTTRRWRKISSAIKGLSKYPPAFGLMGTVLGLVNIMKGLANATEASQLGLEMSIALVATMYGLLIANFIVNPAGELLVKKSEEEEEYADIALEAILLFKDGESLLESQEALNAMVPDEQRLELQSHA